MSEVKITLIPAPKKMTVAGDCRLPLLISADERLAAPARLCADLLKRLYDVEPCAGTGGIMLAVDESLAVGEYRLTSSDSGATITASDDEGARYAVATLMQLVSVDDGALLMPKAEIADRPDCGYRAFMLDLARKWHPFAALLGYVDLCALYKIKYLHLHFVDSQSYTLPSIAFPKMPTEGRHYSYAEIDELNRYAASRGIEIIPEIEVPGHAAAMVRAYPELFADTPIGADTVDSYSLFNNTQKQNIICVGKPGIMDTLRTLVDEVVGMFPDSHYLHIGGDEAKISDWGNCRDCVAYMQEHGIDGPRPLYTHFVKLMTDMVLSLGKTPIVWEGFPREGSDAISRDVVVTAWESYYHLAPELIEEGFNITNSSWQPLYIVPPGHRYVTSGHWEPDEILDWNIYNWQNWNPKTAAYKSPINVAPTGQVLGATLCAWECTYEQEILPVKRNLAAMSERVWNVDATPDKSDFAIALDRLVALADRLMPDSYEA